MGVTSMGALIGGAVDELAGGDNPGEGALIGGVTAGVLKIVLPVIVTYAVGWATLRGLEQLRGALTAGDRA